MEYLYSRELPWDVFVEETILPLYTAYVVSCLGKHFIQSDGFNIYITWLIHRNVISKYQDKPIP